MPTGYTYNIKDGISFKEYAMNCAKAFGACITMGDEQLNKEIPDEFKPSSYHKDRIDEIQKEINELTKLTEKQIKEICLNEYEEEKRRKDNRIKENSNLLNKYENMLKQAKKYNPPSKDHIEFKKFMISQIEESIKFDCDIDYYENQKIILKDYKIYKQDILEDLHRDMLYHVEKYKKEVKIVEGRNKWLKQLRESLNE